MRSRYERYAIHTSRLRGMLTATYVWRIRSMSYVSTPYMPRCFRMYHVCMTYVRRIEPATYVLRIFKCTHKKRSTSAYSYSHTVTFRGLRFTTFPSPTFCPKFVRFCRLLGFSTFIATFCDVLLRIATYCPVIQRLRATVSLGVWYV